MGAAHRIHWSKYAFFMLFCWFSPCFEFFHNFLPQKREKKWEKRVKKPYRLTLENSSLGNVFSKFHKVLNQRVGVNKHLSVLHFSPIFPLALREKVAKFLNRGKTAKKHEKANLTSEYCAQHPLAGWSMHQSHLLSTPGLNLKKSSSGLNMWQ